MNDFYDTRLLYPHSLLSYRPFTVMLVWCFNFTKMFVIIIMYAYFIDISQGSVETNLRHGGIYNNHIIANSVCSVPVKEFRKSLNNWLRYGQKWHVFAHPVLYKCVVYKGFIFINPVGSLVKSFI